MVNGHPQSYEISKGRAGEGNGTGQVACRLRTNRNQLC